MYFPEKKKKKLKKASVYYFGDRTRLYFNLIPAGNYNRLYN